MGFHLDIISEIACFFVIFFLGFAVSLDNVVFLVIKLVVDHCCRLLCSGLLGKKEDETRVCYIVRV